MAKTTKRIIAGVAAAFAALTTYVLIERRKNTKKEDTNPEVEEEAR